MDYKEYRDNQKKQRNSFKKYRKHMVRLLISLLFAGAAAFIFPETIFVALYKFLTGFLGEYVAVSVVVWMQVLCMVGGVLSGIVHAFQAIKAKNDIELSQDEEEDLVDRLINENDELKKKVESLSKTKVNSTSKSNTRIASLRKTNIDEQLEEEKPKVKKYV